MAYQPTGNPVGPPKKELDFDQFEECCGWHCTTEEIAAFFKMHDDTLRKRVEEHYGEEYSAIYKKYQLIGKRSMRRNQFVLSEKNPTLSIWLGKQYLGQSDTPIEIGISNEALGQFGALMAQLSSMQSARKIDNTKMISDK